MLAASASVVRLPVGPVERPLALQICSCPPSWRQPRKLLCKHERPQAAARAAAPIVDRTIFVKISMAGIKNALDLESMDLEEIPPEVFDIPDLKDLTLAGNRITELPAAIGRLTSLERLQLSGNLLKSLPDAIAQLTQLRGLWLHGNLLESIPDSIGELQNLEILSLAGNCLTELPEGIGRLAALEDLGVSGNTLRCLPTTIGQLPSLKKFACNGNMLEELPHSLGDLSSLLELWLQGNQLRNVDSVSSLKNLVTFSAADNPTLQELPSLQHLTALKSLELYGCGLTSISPEVLQLPALRSIWLEGNPLQADSLAPLLVLLSEHTALRDLGLDRGQVIGLADDVMKLAAKQLRLGEVAPGGCGYFKIVSRQNSSDEMIGVAGDNYSSPQSSLVVAFGSAPGVPNWGGLLKRVEVAGSAQPDWSSFDTLFVVDGRRSWYSGGDEGVLLYTERLQAICKRYKTVVMLGDSMGASAALLFAPAATSVLAFCPQVDLSTSSIRPGKSRAWLDVLKHNILCSVREAATQNVSVMVHSGSWEHDVSQARNLPKEHAQLKVHSVDSHRLAYWLDKHNQLVPLVLQALK